jgi:formate--tetrahydrofolate ligase
MLSDIEIAESVKLKPIREVAAEIGISDEELYPFGKYVAKVLPCNTSYNCVEKIEKNKDLSCGGAYCNAEKFDIKKDSGGLEGCEKFDMKKGSEAYCSAEKFDINRKNGDLEGGGSRKCGKLILVTAVNPTRSGEGKTTVSIGLADAIRRLGKKSALALREPSLGPVFGIKGGAAGGGYSQIAPMADINLRFTGDFDAIERANNLLCAAIDNNIYFKTDLKLDPNRIIFKRCMDMNDRALRSVRLTSADGQVFRRDGFNITAASEIMAVFCLSRDFADLKRRLAEIVVGYDTDGKIVKCGRLKCVDAMAILLKDALNPNLVQTLEGTPAFVHGGPFANIAHGCNSVIATGEALGRADYVVTEAGFGADLGAEKFIDIKCRVGGFDIACVVVVATVKALKLNGGAMAESLSAEDLGALKKGLPNLLRHIDNLKNVFKLPVVVALNSFFFDTEREVSEVKKACEKVGAEVFLSEGFTKGGEGCIELAERVVKIADEENEDSKIRLSESKNNDKKTDNAESADNAENYKKADVAESAIRLSEYENNGKKVKFHQEFCYELSDGYAEKLSKIAKKIYRAGSIVLSEKAKEQLAEIENAGYAGLPVCIAKTQYSFSDNPTLLGAPTGFDLFVNEIELRAGAGFVVAICGNMILMPALSRSPGYERMTIGDKGEIRGLS